MCAGFEVRSLKKQVKHILTPLVLYRMAPNLKKDRNLSDFIN